MGQRFDESLDNGQQARSFFEGNRERGREGRRPGEGGESRSEGKKGGDGAGVLQSRIDSVRLNKETAPSVPKGLLLHFLQHPDSSAPLALQSVSSLSVILWSRVDKHPTDLVFLIEQLP